MSDKGLLKGTDGKVRCWWCGDDPQYMRYHDEEWGKPVRDDRAMFEKICLEGFQSGLSWLTILRKRENFRAAFDHFDHIKVARYTQKDIERLLKDEGIVRHRGKIQAVINNAARASELKKEAGSLADFFWSFEPDPKSRPKKMDYKTLTSMPTSQASTALSKALKKRGWKFVGPTTCYAFMQSMGIVNDHLDGCHKRSPQEKGPG